MDHNPPIDFDDLQRRKVLSRTVQALLGPIINWVTTLKPDYKPQGGGPTALEALKRVKITIENLLTRTEQLIVQSVENKHLSDLSIDSLEKARNDLLAAGEELLKKGNEFAQNTSNYAVRQETMEHGRETLMAVARLFDYKIRETFEKIRNSSDTRQLVQTTQVELKEEMEVLTQMTKRRLNDLAEFNDQDNLRSAMALLKITTPILISSSKVCISCPKAEEAIRNRNFAYNDINEALDGVEKVLKGETPPEIAGVALHSKLDPLIVNLEEFKHLVYMEPSAYHKDKNKNKRKMLEELLEVIVVHSADVADDRGSRPERRQQIVDGVNNLRQALQDLLAEYEANKGKVEPSEALDMATINFAHKFKDLRRHLRRAIVDQISDAFCTVDPPLKTLVRCAKQGNRQQTEEAAKIFQEYADNLCRVAMLACKMSPNPEGVGMLRYSTLLLHQLTPQVVNAAFLRCLRPNDPNAEENLNLFERMWEDRAEAMTLAMDSLISVDDFIAVSQQHIHDDVKCGIEAIFQSNATNVDRVAGTIHGRCSRVNDVVSSVIELLDNSTYTETVRNATIQLRNAIPVFDERAEKIASDVERLPSTHDKDGNIPKDVRGEMNEIMEEMVDASNMINSAFDSIRQALLMNRNLEDVDSDNEYEEDGTATGILDQQSQVSDSDVENQQRVMRHLPKQTKEEIHKHVEVFKINYNNFEKVVGRWDEEGNDIIALAKQMGVIMLNMTNFMKGRGPYRTTMDVIRAAQEISIKGKQFEAVAQRIGDEAAETTTKKDLFANINKIILFCHQLMLTSRVKAEVTVVGDEKRFEGLEATTSLIQNARNLLAAVMQAVKLAYIASTKDRGKGRKIVEWKVAAPLQTMPLAESIHHRNGNGLVRRVSEKRLNNGMSAIQIR
ncbi:Protein humpback-1 [Aphelenchoides besseyi]|nr:Protein humpback-1 [Aphelenchoides besseyi]